MALLWVGMGWCGNIYYLVESQAIERGGCGNCSKGRNGGKRDKIVCGGEDTKPVVLSGATSWQKRVE
jgi:hypothetical protein